MVAAPITLSDCVIDAQEGFDKIYDLLQLRGGIVVKNLIAKEDALKVRDELEEPLQQERNRIDQTWEGTFFPSTTVKVAGLVTKSPTYAEKIVLNPTLLRMAQTILTRRDKLPAGHAEYKWCTSEPTINTTGILEIHSGGRAQCLHRDDVNLHNVLPEVSKWHRDREVSILCFVALSRVTPENGGTLFVPGSHCWGYDRKVPTADEALAADMEIGDTFIMLCSTFHGGGANRVPAGEENSIRTIAMIGYNRGYLRPEETPFLVYKPEDVKKLPVKLQEMCGYSISRPALGIYNFGHPRKALGYDIPDGDDQFWDENQDD